MRAYAVKLFREPIVEIEAATPQPKRHRGRDRRDAMRGLPQRSAFAGGVLRSPAAARNSSLAGPRRRTPPVVLGHEVLGRLAAKGPDAPIGDEMIGKTFVVYPWLGFAGEDARSAGVARRTSCAKPCSIGVHRAGGYAEKCLVPHPRYLVDVTGIDPTLAATLLPVRGWTAYRRPEEGQRRIRVATGLLIRRDRRCRPERPRDRQGPRLQEHRGGRHRSAKLRRTGRGIRRKPGGRSARQ